MAWAEVASQRASGSGTTYAGFTVAFPNNVTSGNLLVVLGAAWENPTVPGSVAVTDTRGTSYTVALGTVIGSERTFIAYGLAPSSGACTVTVVPDNSAGSVASSASIDEFSGAHATPADVNGGTSTGTSTAPADAITTVAANALIVGVMTQDGGDMTLALAGGSAFTQIGENEDNTGMQSHHAAFRIVTAATAYTATWLTGSSVLWAAQTHSFAPAAADVAFLNAVELERIDTSDPATWTHVPGGTARAIVVAVVQSISFTDHVSSVTYGGVPMTLAKRQTDELTELGAASLWFLGSGIPTGNQTVSADLSSGTTDDMHFVSLSYSAAADCEVVDSDSDNAFAANPSLTLQYAGRTCAAVGALYSGLPNTTDFAPNANCSAVATQDFGAAISVVFQQTTPGTSDFAIGGTSASDDTAFVAIAISKVSAGAAFLARPPLIRAQAVHRASEW